MLGAAVVAGLQMLTEVSEQLVLKMVDIFLRGETIYLSTNIHGKQF